MKSPEDGHHPCVRDLKSEESGTGDPGSRESFSPNLFTIA